MLKVLAQRENGAVSPNQMYTADCTRRAYSLELTKHIDVEKIHEAGVNSLSVDMTDGRYLLSGAADGMIVIYDLHNSSGIPSYTIPAVCRVGRSNPDMHKYSVETVQWYPVDTGMFLSSGMDRTLKVWDTNSLTAVDIHHFSEVVYSHDMSYVATKHSLVVVGLKNSLARLLDLRSGSSTHTLKGHRKPVTTVKWSTRDEFLLATGSEDNRVLLWDVRRAKGSLAVLDQHSSSSEVDPSAVHTAHNGHVNGILFTQDGLYMLTFGTDECLRLWSTCTATNMLVNYGRIDNDSRKCIKFATSLVSSQPLVYIPAEGNIKVLEIFTGCQVDILRGHYNQVNCCTYHPNTHELYSCANDRNILVWSADAAAAACSHNENGQNTQQSHHFNSFHSQIGVNDSWSSDEGE